MISALRIECWIPTKLRASFVHTHRTAVKRGSIQRGNGVLGLCRLRHLRQCDAAGFAPFPILDDRDGLDAFRGVQKFPQLLLRYRDIQVCYKNVSHEFILFLISRNLAIRSQRGNSKGDLEADPLSQGLAHSERLYVLSLPALWALALLQAPETTGLNR